MRKLVIVLISLLVTLPLAAQDAQAQKKFGGTWEAKVKEKVICTLRLTAGDSLSGEMANCSIDIDANGDLQEPASEDHPDSPSPMMNIKIQDDTLSFEEKDGDDMIKFELKVVGDGQAELKILDSPIAVKPIHFSRK